MDEVKYHRDVYMPSKIELEALSLLVRMDGRYTLTEHAKERMVEKGVRLPEQIPFQECQVIEVTATGKNGEQVRKCLVRFDHGDGKNDVCLSFTDKGTVATVFLNRKDDEHSTLDLSPYVQKNDDHRS